MSHLSVPQNVEIQNWHDLPCVIMGDTAVLFSYIGDNLVCTKVPKNKLTTAELLGNANNCGLFSCLDENGHKEIEIKQLTLCLTEKCNCKCRYCFLDANTVGNTMSTNTMHKALEFAFDKYRGHEIIVSAFGGEPGTREDLVREMVRYSEIIKNEYNVIVQYAITTNGVISDSLIHFLIEWNFVCTLSVDGVEVVQNYQRPLANGAGSFEKVYHTMKALSAGGVYLKVRSTVTSFSAPYMEDSVRLFGEIGVKQIHFEPVTPAGRALSEQEATSLPPSPKEYCEYLLKCIEIAQKYNARINFSFCSKCTGILKNKMIVGANGMISSCVEVQNERHEFSNYFRVGQFKERENVIIVSDSKIVATDSKQYFKQDKCLNCPYKIFCKDSCPIRNYRATGDFHQTEPYKCELFHLIMPHILYNLFLTTFSNV